MAQRWKSLGTLLLFAALAVVHTWPLATAPARLSRNDNPDTVLNEWILAWVEHQGVRHPAHLLDGNIFFPDRHTLAYSEYLIVPAAMGAPLSWAGASPVLVYNMMLLAGLALTGWAACRLVWRWTGDIAAGVLTGSVLAFNSHTLTHLPQLQGLHLEFVPLALLALDALLAEPRARRAVVLALWLTLQALTSYYGLMLMLVALGAGIAVRPADWTAGRARPVLPRLALAGAVAAACAVPLLLPYERLGQVRTLDEVALYAATWRDYLASPSRLHYPLWSARFFGGATALFAGVTTLALAACAAGTGTAFRDRRARMALAFGAAGFALSFGPFLPGYALLYRFVPLLQGIRNAARFGYLTIAGLGILAGFGLARLRVRLRGTRWLAAATAAAVLAANIEAFSAPIEYVDAGRVPPLVAHLRSTGAVVAEFPFYPPDHVFHNAAYLLDAAANWRPMLNGYSGITPPSYVAHAAALARFPDRRSIDALRAFGVTHVVVRYKELADWTDNETVDAVRRSPDLRLLGTDGQIGVYVLRTAGESS